ncbi:MAG: pyridoxamine 5'-phosphate oxidase family protein [Candidatus Krumholzibacteriota bacterium]|nr:pyridoxamine 5'-phosphate oxidase family protein [Candidatus Krumholzibacteriota bacterium]
MRRHEQEIADHDALEAVIAAAQVCRLAVADGETPCIVPLCFGYEAERLYFHSAPAGRKIDLLKSAGRAAFEVETDVKFTGEGAACNRTMRYRSVIGAGAVVFVEDEAEKQLALTLISRQYGCADETFPPGVVEKTTVFRLDVEEMTGKRSG